MADVKSYRISNEIDEKLKQLKEKSGMTLDQVFHTLFKAYEENHTLAGSGGENAAYLANMRALCDNIYDSFRLTLEGRAADTAAIKETYAAEIEKKDKIIGELKEQVVAAEKQAAEAQKQLDTYKEEIHTLKELNEALKGKNEALEENIRLKAPKERKKRASKVEAIETDESNESNIAGVENPQASQENSAFHFGLEDTEPN